MPDLNPTITGRLRNSINQVGTAAWNNTMPDVDSVCSEAGAIESQQATSIYCLNGWAFENYGVTDVRCVVMSFNTSALIKPQSATLKIYGYGTNTATGQPTSHASNGILGLKTTLGATDSLSTSDWPLIDLGGAGPTLYTDTLTSWNGSDGLNTFTLNDAALTDIGNNSTFQIAIFHKYFYDFYDSNPPFDWGGGNNSPNGDNDWTTVAGAHYGVGDNTDKAPVLSYVAGVGIPAKTRIKISSGTFSFKGGNHTIK